MDAHLRSAYERMRDAAAAKGRVIVAYSGGVDSGLVARTVHDAIGDRALAILADTESFSRRELVEARVEAEEIGIPLRVVGMSELASEDYRRNPANRCYFCREGLADELVPIARREGFAAIADGVNVSDLGDVEPGLSKADVRALARGLGLSFWDKPSNACLSSRVPHGTPITVELLRRVETAEEVLRGRGFRQVRVRHEQETARIEVPPEDIPRLRTVELEVAAALRAIGYRSVVIDPAGYRSLG